MRPDRPLLYRPRDGSSPRRRDAPTRVRMPRTVGGVSIPGLPNGRDLGGLPCDGGIIRSGLLFRSAAPADQAASAAMASLGIRTVVDLRTSAEREQQPTVLPLGAVRRGADVLADASYAGAANLGKLAAEALSGRDVADGFAGRDLRAIMLESYRDFAELGSGRRAVAEVLHILADPASGPVLLHCTAGKDRTGWVIAVVLHIAGVPWDAIMEDYLLSGPEVRAIFSVFLDSLGDGAAAAEVLGPVLGVFPEYLESARSSAEREFGSMEGYLHEGLRLEHQAVDAIRTRLLEAR